MLTVDGKRAALKAIIADTKRSLQLARDLADADLILLLAQTVDAARLAEDQLEADELQQPTDRRN